MVTKVVQAVQKRFTDGEGQPLPRRLLLIIRAKDGDLVLQNKHNHQPKQRYATEARTLAQWLFSKKPKGFCAKTKAEDVIHQTLDFRRIGDMSTKPHFLRESIEWHPVLLDIHWLFEMEAVQSIAKQGTGLHRRILQPLEEHPFAEKLRSLFPRT